jgi:hypothetical protein
MITVLVWITGLLGTLLLTVGGVVYLVVTLMDGRPWRIHVPAGMLCGYAAGALFVWNLAPSGWKLPLSARWLPASTRVTGGFAAHLATNRSRTAPQTQGTGSRSSSSRNVL